MTRVPHDIPSILCVALLTAALGPVATASAETLSLQVKSYISSVNLLDPNQFDPDAKSCQAAMAALVNCGTLNEDPPDGKKASKDYRLWSEVTIDATCSGNKLSKWDMKPVQQDFGSEFVIFSTTGNLAKPLTATPALKGSTPTDKVDFGYRLRGQPNQAGIDVMNKVKPRTCSFIWHEVAGTLSCQSGKPVLTANLNGSKFPSHRLWSAGQPIKQNQQGPFKNLWKCSPTDPLMVQ